MRSRDYVGSALTLWRANEPRVAGRWEVRTWCLECGEIHEMEVVLPDPGVQEDTMLHQPWCSVDMRNIRRAMRRVRE
jgi:hypothetical protein